MGGRDREGDGVGDAEGARGRKSEKLGRGDGASVSVLGAHGRQCQRDGICPFRCTRALALDILLLLRLVESDAWPRFAHHLRHFGVNILVPSPVLASERERLIDRLIARLSTFFKLRDLGPTQFLLKFDCCLGLSRLSPIASVPRTSLVIASCPLVPNIDPIYVLSC